MSGAELPEGWAETTVGDVLDFKYGKSLRGEDRDGGAFPVYGSSGEVGRHSEALTTGPTIIVGRKGSIGKVYFSPGPAFAIDTAYYIDSFGPFAPEYIVKWLASARMDEMDRASAIPGLNRNDAYDLPVSVPPLPEQKRIVARLDALQARSRTAREALAEVPALLDTFRQSVLAAAFRGDLTAEWRAKNPDVEPASKLLERIRAERKKRWELANPKKKYVEPEAVDASELPELPEGWCWTTIETVGDVVNGRQRAAPVPGRMSTPYLRIANIQDDYIDFSDLNDMDHDPDAEITYCVRPGDILVSGGQSLQKVGQSALFELGMPSVGFQKNLFRFRGSESLPDPRFAQLVFRAWVLTGVFRRRASITTNLAYMTTTKFAQCPFPLPPAAEQCALVTLAGAALDGVDRAAGEVEVLMADLDTLDQSILARAFRGELVDQDPNDEPADALLGRIRADTQAAAPKKRGRGA